MLDEMSTHCLAQHYENEKMISAEIFHLEKAGFEEKARQRARMAFLQGRNWPQLWGYVLAHKLVSVSEVVTVVNSSPNIEGIHCLADVVAGVGGPDHAELIWMPLVHICTASGTTIFGRQPWQSAI